MAGTEVTAYAAGLRDQLADLGVDVAPLDELIAAGQALATTIDVAPDTLSEAAWTQIAQRWEQARDAISQHLAEVLLGALADLPGLAQLAADAGSVSRSGIHGEVDIGAGSPLGRVVDPGGPAAEVARRHAFRTRSRSGLSRSVRSRPVIVSPFGGGKGMPGGGSIVRLPGDGGYGGTLELPLGPVQVSAAAALAMIDGQPSFLAILGATFLPPIQLSFGFSLDRVGGIVGVNRRADTDALTRRGPYRDRWRRAIRRPAAGIAARAGHRGRPAVPVPARDAPRRPFTASVVAVVRAERKPALARSRRSSSRSRPGRVVILGVARASIPGLPFVLNLRLDLLGVIDPVEQLVSIDASLVDSHVLGVFEVYGDAAMRLSWGSDGYAVVSVGGFYPGFNPEPARIPALRRVGLSMDNPIPIIEIRAEGYFAVTSNSIQFGGRLEVGISLGIEAHGFLQVDAIVQFRPFRFEAQDRGRLRRLRRRVQLRLGDAWRGRSPARARS